MSSSRNLGQELLNHLTDNSYVSAQTADGKPVLFIWNSNAAEQLEAWLHANAVDIYQAVNLKQNLPDA